MFSTPLSLPRAQAHAATLLSSVSVSISSSAKRLSPPCSHLSSPLALTSRSRAAVHSSHSSHPSHSSSQRLNPSHHRFTPLIARAQGPALAAAAAAAAGRAFSAKPSTGPTGSTSSGTRTRRQSQDQANKAALADPEKFWSTQAASLGIKWDKEWDSVIDDSDKPIYRWFKGAKLNTAYNALDIHVEEGRGNHTALIFHSAITSESKRFSFRELRDRVAVLAGALEREGVGKGDRVVIYMPMVPEAVMAMLACARIGAVHSVVFGGFAAPELATRLKDAQPKVILSASCGLEGSRVIHYKPLLDKAVELSPHKPQRCVILQRPQWIAPLNSGLDVDWDEFQENAPHARCASMEATDPLYILYTSGTTGQPKGVVRDCGGHMVAVKWSFKNVFDAKPKDVWWAASDVGWVVGHSYIVYAPLTSGITTVMFEGKPVGTPDAGAFWRVVDQYKVTGLFAAPTAFRAIRRDDPNGVFLKKLDMSSLRSIFMAGERLDPETLHWVRSRLPDVEVVDNYWQTETGWPIVACAQGMGKALTVKPGSSGKALPGYDVQCLDPQTGQPVEPGHEGELAIKLPLPPGTLPYLYKAKDRYISSYLSKFPGYYQTGDSGFIDEDGYIFAMHRVDDVINTAGHRLSTGAMEEVVAQHPSVAECAVIGAKDNLKGEIPIGFVVLKSGVELPHQQIASQIAALIRENIGPVASFQKTYVVKNLPKTRSGKLLRRSLRHIVDHGSLKGHIAPPTIEDPAVLEDVNLVVNPPHAHSHSHSHSHPPAAPTPSKQ